ncbi:MAG: PIG-L family deacetylase [Acidobacteria bacterium]|nr:PIG-L family deacetylase [Acidobacteriota bacterium]
MVTRRGFLTTGGLLMPLAQGAVARPLKVVCVGGHPDDPESGCGGTLARYAAEGHRVSIVYLTRGERGVQGKSLEEAAAIRTAEAEAACRILGAKAIFAGQIDGDTEVNSARIEAFKKLLAAEAPDVMLAHWPIDSHADHQAASLLAMRSYFALKDRPVLYFFEVNSGFQSMAFKPTHYVDILAVREKKKAALFAHHSQNGEHIYRVHHEVMENYRGRESGLTAAEGFVLLPRDGKMDRLPGV